MLKFTIKDNRSEIIHELENKKTAILEAVGLQAESNAKLNCPVDTGNLRNSITHTVSGDTVYIGTNVEYGVWNEVGTGIYADDGQGRKSPWAYQDSKGVWHNTHGIKPAHFLRNSISEHMDEYKQIIADGLKDIKV